jgi:putative hemolysin
MDGCLRMTRRSRLSRLSSRLGHIISVITKWHRSNRNLVFLPRGQYQYLYGCASFVRKTGAGAPFYCFRRLSV